MIDRRVNLALLCMDNKYEQHKIKIMKTKLLLFSVLSFLLYITGIQAQVLDTRFGNGIGNVNDYDRWNTDKWAYTSDAIELEDVLIVSGNFERAGSILTKDIAIFDKRIKQWFPLGDGIGGFKADTKNDYVNKMLIYKGELYVAGKFDSIGNLPARNIAKFNFQTQQWSALRFGTDAEINTLFIYKDSLLVGGKFGAAYNSEDRSDITRTSNVAKWNHTEDKWEGLGVDGGLATSVNAFASYNDTLYAVGDFSFYDRVRGQYNRIAKCIDNKWIPSEIPCELGLSGYQPSILSAVFDNKGTLYVAGEFDNIDKVSDTGNIARWEDGEWKALGTGTNRLDFVYGLATDGEDIYFCGKYNKAASIKWTGLAKWDSETNEITPVLNEEGGAVIPGQPLHSVNISGNKLIITGQTDGYVLIPTYLSEVTVDSKNILSYDLDTKKFGIYGGGIQWSSSYQGTPFLSMANIGEKLYIAGSFVMADGIPANGIAEYDNNTQEWGYLNGGMSNSNTYITAMTTDEDGYLYVTGTFKAAGGIAAKNVAKYNTNTGEWEAIGEGISNVSWPGPKSIVAASSNKIYVGDGEGLFIWDGSTWTKHAEYTKLYLTQVYDMVLTPNKDSLWVVGINGKTGTSALAKFNLTKNEFDEAINDYKVDEIIQDGHGGYLLKIGTHLHRFDGVNFTDLTPTSTENISSISIVADSMIVGTNGTTVKKLSRTGQWEDLFENFGSSSGISVLHAFNKGFFFGGEIFRVNNISTQNIGSWNVMPEVVFPDVNIPTENGSGLRLHKTENQLTVYPNPAKDVVNINNLKPNTTITISDLTGKTVYQSEVQAANATMDVSAVPAGIYLIQAKNDNRMESAKIVIQ